MKNFEILGGKAHVVELPEGAKFPRIETNQSIIPYGQDLCWDRNGGEKSYGMDETEWVGLPPGTWQIVGMLPELFYHDFDGLIKPTKVFDYTAHHWNYVDKEYQPIMHIESFHSAIRASGWYLENPVKVHTWASENADNYKKQFDEAQSRVLSRERCLLLRRVES